MAKVDMNKECLIRCDHCGEINSIALGRIFGARWWWKQDCIKCEKKLKRKKDSLVTAVCPHCGKMVQKTDDSICLNCGKILYRDNEAFPVVCDNCGTTSMVPYQHGSDVSCQICGTHFPSSKLRDKPQTIDSTPQYILLKDQQKMLAEDLVIWKHPMNQFSMKSRLQVNPGTTALFLQNGVCQDPCGPGDYLLEKTGLTREEKLNAAAGGDDVVLHTEIFCVIDTLPEIRWGTPANAVLVRNSGGNKVYRITASGTVVWNVANAKVFAEKVGFREIHGTAELTKVDPTPGSVDAPLVRETRKAVSEALRRAVGDMIIIKQIDPMDLQLEKSELEANVIDELDRIMTDYGLTTGNLKLDKLEAALNQDSGLTVETKRRETIRRAAQKRYSWRTENIRLLAGTDPKLYADYTFNGTIRLRIDDENRFFSIPEIEALKDDPAEAESFFSRLIAEQTAACIKPAAQSVITEERVPITELDLNMGRIEKELLRGLNTRMMNEGLAAESINLDQPQYRESEALRIEAEKNERRKILIRYAGKPIDWRAEPVEVHMKNNRGLSAQVVFSGTCTLKVTDERLFFANPENAGYLEQNPFVDEATVNRTYARLISKHFYTKLAAMTQDRIDNFDWDARELERYQADLEQIASNTLAKQISGWGMEVQNSYLRKPEITLSAALQKLINQETHRAVTEIQEETDKTDDAYEMNRARAEAGKTMEKDDIETQTYAHKQQNAANRIVSDEAPKDALAEAEIKELERRAQIEAKKHAVTMQQQGFETEEAVGSVIGAGKVDQAKDDREAAAVLRKKDLERSVEKAEIDKEKMVEEARRSQEQAEAEHKRILEDIRHQTGLDDAKFKETLNDIMHRIDQSDLDWRQKLDEYNRMSRNLGVQDAENARLLAAKTDAEIDSLRTASGYEAGMKKVQLNGAQADLQEKIDRYAEDRAERIAKADAERRERASVLAFEQQMEDRKQKAEEQLTSLKEQHAENVRSREHEERMEAMKAEIEKLKLELDAEKHKVSEEADLGKHQSADEAKVREAEAAAAKERAERQEQREDALMNRAESLFRYVTEIKQAMDQANKELQKHLDDNETGVRKEYAQVEKVRAEGMNEQERRDIVRKLDDLEKAVADNGIYGEKRKRYSEDQYNEIIKKIRTMMDELDEMKKAIKKLEPDGRNNRRNCWSCGTVLNGPARFCPMCGASQTPHFKAQAGTANTQPGVGVRCPVCDTMNPAGAKICQGCGKTLF